MSLMLGLLWRFKNQLLWISGTVALTSIWLAFIYLFNPNRTATLATAFATACLIALIQAHYQK
jgi:hypothetical protein